MYNIKYLILLKINSQGKLKTACQKNHREKKFIVFRIEINITYLLFFKPALSSIVIWIYFIWVGFFLIGEMERQNSKINLPFIFDIYYIRMKGIEPLFARTKNESLSIWLHSILLSIIQVEPEFCAFANVAHVKDLPRRGVNYFY
jgi:hypothetical protein